MEHTNSEARKHGDTVDNDSAAAQQQHESVRCLRTTILYDVYGTAVRIRTLLTLTL